MVKSKYNIVVSKVVVILIWIMIFICLVDIYSEYKFNLLKGYFFII